MDGQALHQQPKITNKTWITAMSAIKNCFGLYTKKNPGKKVANFVILLGQNCSSVGGVIRTSAIRQFDRGNCH